MRTYGYLRIIVLLPFIVLVRIIAKHDAHLFRYWAVDSMDYWRRWESTWTWKAYAFALLIWAILFGGLYFLVRCLH